MFLYKTRLERAQYRYKKGSTNEFLKFSKFIPFFEKIGIFRGYEKWSLAVLKIILKIDGPPTEVMEAFTELVTRKQHDEIGRDISRKTKAAKEAQKRKAEEAAAAASSSTERYFSKSIFDWATFVSKLSEIMSEKSIEKVIFAFH